VTSRIGRSEVFVDERLQPVEVVAVRGREAVDVCDDLSDVPGHHAPAIRVERLQQSPTVATGGLPGVPV
jgi:hypothetical protein